MSVTPHETPHQEHALDLVVFLDPLLGHNEGTETATREAMRDIWAAILLPEQLFNHELRRGQ